MRKGMDGLATLIQDSLELDPYSESIFLFSGTSKDRHKCLYFSGDQGPVLLSGYTHEHYLNHLKDWTQINTDSTALGGAKRIGSLWINPVAAEQLQQLNLFEMEMY